MTSLPVVNLLWIGSELGWIEHLSAASFLAAGHPVKLHAYDEVKNVPHGVEIADAGALMTMETALAMRHRQTKSFALSSDYFRFLLQKRGLGLWSDLDVVCLAPVALRDPVLFGWESDAYINGAVLYIAPGHELLDDALGAFEPNHIPAWVPFRKALPFRARRAIGTDFGPGDLPRGTYGPKALTALARKHRLLPHAQPTDVFYPLHPRQARQIFSPGTEVEQFTSARSLTIHLWNEKLGELKRQTPPSTSAIAKLLRRFGL